MNEARNLGVRRTVFLSVSAALLFLTLVLSHAVLLPFVLALLIAYVLTPAVTWAETKRVPRAVAILLVYGAVLGSAVAFFVLAAPRLVREVRGLSREVPALLSDVKGRVIPEVASRLRALGGGAVAIQAPESREEEAGVVATPQEDGRIFVDIGTGFRVTEVPGGFVVEPAREKGKAFDAEQVLSELVGKSVSFVQENSIQIAKMGRDLVAGVSRVIFLFFITLMLAAYIMLTREKIFAFLTSFLRPGSQPQFQILLSRIDRGLSGVVRGQLIICLVNGVLSAIGFAFVGLKYWPVLALVAAVFSLIPIFGSIVSSVPAVLVGLTQGLGTAAFVLAWIVGIHQVEANFLNPKIMGDAAKIHPVLVVFSLLLGEHFFGAVGALLAVPCMSMAISLFVHFKDVSLENASLELETPSRGPEER